MILWHPFSKPKVSQLLTAYDFIVIIPASKDKEELITRLKDEIIKLSRAV